MITKSEIKTHCINDLISTVLENLTFRFIDHCINVVVNTQARVFYARYAEAEALGAMTNLLDNSIYWTRTARAEGNRKIYIYVTDEIPGFVTMVVCDNGPGFKIDIDSAKEPFVSDKPLGLGMGLGLHITNEIMKAMDGKLLITPPYEYDLPATATAMQLPNYVVALSFPKVEK